MSATSRPAASVSAPVATMLAWFDSEVKLPLMTLPGRLPPYSCLMLSVWLTMSPPAVSSSALPRTAPPWLSRSPAEVSTV
ncbi:hypothetical protein, partial [Rugamonas rubra]|uniref:hypothetical protein n=1 Tax=Rugamonas rubra TaxID=758825 RepID=UPI001C2CF023